ncbi:hypothetical protein ID866_11440 [Astraeus odoratus]|nr:hypothetical protein ID866_11440 [Astraeus odoratus]
MQTRLRTHTQTECKDAEHFLSGSHQIPSVSDHQPPLSTWCLSPTTPCQEPHIRTLAEELEDAEFRTPDGPGGNDPDPDDSDDDDGGDDNAPDPDTEDNPLLALINTISCLSCTTRRRPKDSGAACTKVCEPDTFDGTDLKKLHEFLIQCELNFCNRPQAFCLDSRKVGFALSFLKGIALAWFKPDLLDAIPGAEPAWADDYSEFIIELTTNFSPHNPVSDAEHQLNNLLMKDGSQINKYIIEFNRLATQVRGYGEEHKSEIARQAKTNPQPSSSSKQSLSGGSSSKQSNPSSGTSSLSSTGKGKNPQCPSSSTPKSSNPSAPDLSGIIGKDGKLTTAEHLHRIKNALCLFCGLPGHSAKDCPRFTSRAAKACAAQAASVAASTVETPAEAKK